MLSGSPPFYEDEKEDLFEKIRSGKFDFDTEVWQNVSEEAKDFITKLLVVDPTKRMNCD